MTKPARNRSEGKPASTDTPPQSERKGLRSFFAPALLLLLLTVAAYFPAINAGFIWDDDDYVTQNTTLRDASGLKRIWADPQATPQYYPLVHTTFWLEYQAWRLNAGGYHVVNILLHALAAILLTRVLQRLQVRGAWIAGFIFALHPVMVESVAWITERKNVLSAVFYFSAALAYLRWTGNASRNAADGRQKSVEKSAKRETGFYWLGFALFICALLSKTVTCSLPAALLLIAWWKKGKLAWRDIVPLIPFFVIGILSGLTTAYLEKHHVGAKGADWTLTFVERCLIAGRALWFYAGKLVWPTNLTFIYPRWEISTAIWWQWIFPVAAVAVVATLWLLRNRIGRGPLVAALFFGGTLFPALGFIDVYPMRYSFVADHFQYIASVGLIVLMAAGLVRVAGRLWLVPTLGLAVLAWQQTHSYRDLETLWTDTIEKNPACWMAHNNLGHELAERGELRAAKWHHHEALRLKPDYAEALNNLGSASLKEGRLDEAIDYFRRALNSDPLFPSALNNLGVALLQKGNSDEALENIRAAFQLNPNDPNTMNNMGAVLSEQKRWAEALLVYEKSMRLDSAIPLTRFNYANALNGAGRTDEALSHLRGVLADAPENPQFRATFARMLAQRGRTDEALREFQEAARLSPSDATTRYNWGVVLAGAGRASEALEQFRAALAINPDYSQAHNNLAVALASSGELNEAMTHFNEALRLDPDYAEAHNNLAFVLARLNRRDDAIKHLREALRLRPDYAQAREQLRGLGVSSD